MNYGTHSAAVWEPSDCCEVLSRRVEIVGAATWSASFAPATGAGVGSIVARGEHTMLTSDER